MLEAVCFDLDGTLIDSTDAIVDSFNHAFAAMGENVPERERIVETISVPLEEQFRLLSVKDPDRAAEVYRAQYIANRCYRQRRGATENSPSSRSTYSSDPLEGRRP